MENEQILLTDIPKSETLVFTPLLPNFKKLLIIQWVIFYCLVLFIDTIAYFIFSDIDYVWIIAGCVALACVICLPIHIFLINKGFSYKGYAIREYDIHYKTGYFTRKITTIPIHRIQHLEIRQGFISRILKLAKLVVYTAGDHGADLSIKGISVETAEDIKQLLTSKDRN